MKYLLSIACMLLVLCTTAKDKKEKATQKTKIRGLHFVFPFEHIQTDNTDINTEFNKAKLPASKSPFLSFGVGIQYYHDRFVFRGAMSSASNVQKQPNSDVRNTLISYSLNAGYDCIKKMDYSLYPFAGYRFCSYNYLYNQKTTAPQTINGYLTTPLDHKEIRNSRSHADLGVGFSYQKEYLVGIRAGYLLPIGDAKWKVNQNKITLLNTPGMDYLGYVTITIGLGTMKTEKPKP